MAAFTQAHPSDDHTQYNSLNPLPWIEVYEDPTARLTLRDVLDPAIEFQKNTQQDLNFNFSDSAFWLRMPLTNPTDQPVEWLLEVDYPTLDHVHFYAQNKDGSWAQTLSGDHVPFVARESFYRNFVFSLTIAPQSTQNSYLRVESQSAVAIPLTLWKEQRFQRKVANENLFYGLFAGAILVLAFYSLVLFSYTRHASYAFYAGYIISATVQQIVWKGLGAQYLWPNLTWVNDVFIPLFQGLIVLCIVCFTQKFLNIKALSPQLNRVLQALILMSLCFPFLPWVISYSRAIEIMVYLMLMVPLILIPASVLAWIKGQKSAKYFVISWLAIGTGMALTLSHVNGWLPSNTLTENGFMFGLGFEALILSLGLGKQVNEIYQERLIYQKQLVNSLQREKQQQAEHSVELENKVAQRTEELMTKNHEMQTDLKMAGTVQNSLIPDLALPDFVNVNVCFQPYEAVSGDIYHIHRPNEHSVEIFLGDATGHGVTAAFITIMVTMALKQSDPELEPHQIMDELHQVMEKYSPEDRFMTGVLMRVHRDGTVCLSNAAHPPVVLLPADEGPMVLFSQSSHALGMFHELTREYNTLRHQLKPGDRLLLFSDGLYERYDSSGEFFGFQAFVDQLSMMEAMAVDKMETYLKTLGGLLKEHEGITDDLTLIIIEYKGTSGELV